MSRIYVCFFSGAGSIEGQVQTISARGASGHTAELGVLRQTPTLVF